MDTKAFACEGELHRSCAIGEDIGLEVLWDLVFEHMFEK